jgi:hypothetical protein
MEICKYMGGWSYQEFRDTPARFISHIKLRMSIEASAKNFNSKKNAER